MEVQRIRRVQRTFQVFGSICLLAVLYYFLSEGNVSIDKSKTSGSYQHVSTANTAPKYIESKQSLRKVPSIIFVEEDAPFPDEWELLSQEGEGEARLSIDNTREEGGEDGSKVNEVMSSSPRGDGQQEEPVGLASSADLKDPSIANHSNNSSSLTEMVDTSSTKAKMETTPAEAGSGESAKVSNEKARSKKAGKSKEKIGEDAKSKKRKKTSTKSAEDDVLHEEASGNVTSSTINALSDASDTANSTYPQERWDKLEKETSEKEEKPKAESERDTKAESERDTSVLPETNDIEETKPQGVQEESQVDDQPISPQAYFEMALALGSVAQQSGYARSLHQHIPLPPVNEKANSAETDLFGAGVSTQEELDEIQKATPGWSNGQINIGNEARHPMVFLSPKVPHPFLIAGLPKDAGSLDVISSSIYNSGVFAPCESMLFHRILEGKCGQPTPMAQPEGFASTPGATRRLLTDESSDHSEVSSWYGHGIPLVVDVGANMGYFTLLAASYGCRVVGFEAQKHLFPFLSTSILVNDFERLANVYNNAAGASNDVEVSFAHPHFTGGWSLGRVVTDDGAENTYKVTGRRLDSVVQEDILLLKIDVEGHGHEVLSGATKIFQMHEVMTLIMEANVAQDDEAFIALMKAEGYYVFGYSERYLLPIHSRCWSDFEDCFTRCGVSHAMTEDGALQVNSDYILTRDPSLGETLEAMVVRQ